MGRRWRFPEWTAFALGALAFVIFIAFAIGEVLAG